MGLKKILRQRIKKNKKKKEQIDAINPQVLDKNFP